MNTEETEETGQNVCLYKGKFTVTLVQEQVEGELVKFCEVILPLWQEQI